MSNLLFPTLSSLGWTVKMAPEYFTEVQKAAAPGYETRLSYGPDPIYHFELSYEVLRENLLAYNELRRILGFFNQCRGNFASFLLNLTSLTQNINDSYVAGQVLTVDANGYAPVVVTRDYDTENIYQLAGVNGNPGTAPQIYVGGVLQTLGINYNIVGPGVATSSTTYPGLVIQFITSPGSNVVTANFSWYYQVRFEESKQDFDLFSYLFWECKSLKLIETRTGLIAGSTISVDSVPIGTSGGNITVDGAAV